MGDMKCFKCCSRDQQTDSILEYFSTVFSGAQVLFAEQYW